MVYKVHTICCVVLVKHCILEVFGNKITALHDAKLVIYPYCS